MAVNKVQLSFITFKLELKKICTSYYDVGEKKHMYVLIKLFSAIELITRYRHK